jgi:hypothetical protein
MLATFTPACGSLLLRLDAGRQHRRSHVGSVGDLAVLSRKEVLMVPDLTAYDWIVINSSAGKDSQAMLDYVVEQADVLKVPHSSPGAL